MPLDKTVIRKVVRLALREDRARHDITTRSFIPASRRAEARIIAKSAGVVCGMEVARQTFLAFDSGVVFTSKKRDGQSVRPSEVLAVVRGKARSILSCERVALNFLAHLSGIAASTAAVTRKVSDLGIRILDTRKTTPLLRAFEKYAVRVGGGQNHRFDLSERFLVKDNHLFILRRSGSLSRLARRGRGVVFEIEVENFRQLKEALAVAPDILMLDNFSPAQVRRAVAFLRAEFGAGRNRPKIELSGGIRLSNISRYAIKGVDFISLGALTQSSKALDVSLELTN